MNFNYDGLGPGGTERGRDWGDWMLVLSNVFPRVQLRSSISMSTRSLK